jgi:hypothetical protein
MGWVTPHRLLFSLAALSAIMTCAALAMLPNL